MNIETLLKEKKGTIIDVRTETEFKLGHADASVNIPLSELSSRIEELKKFKEPFLLCCASGGRSAQAHIYLSMQGFESVNAGSWLDVLHFQSMNGN